MADEDGRIWAEIRDLREISRTDGLKIAMMYKDIETLEEQSKRRSDRLFPMMSLTVSALALATAIWFHLHP
jgi:hypothetical protein